MIACCKKWTPLQCNMTVPEPNAMSYCVLCPYKNLKFVFFNQVQCSQWESGLTESQIVSLSNFCMFLWVLKLIAGGVSSWEILLSGTVTAREEDLRSVHWVHSVQDV